jgi:hypothetical protein
VVEFSTALGKFGVVIEIPLLSIISIRFVLAVTVFLLV